MLNNRITKGITAAGVAALVALGSVAVAGAQEGPSDDAERKGYVGTVSSYDGSTLVVETTNPEVGSATLAVTDDTTVKTPGNEMTAGTLEEGARVAVLGVLEEDGTWTALQILVKPTSPLTSAVSGAVVNRENGTLTIQLPNGETRELQVGDDEDAPEVGDVVTAFVRDDQDAGPPNVVGLEKADEVRARLEGFLEEAGSGDLSGLPPSVAAARDEVAARLGAVIDRLGQTQEEILQRAADNPNIPAEARARIESALDTARTRIQEARGRVDGILERIGLPPTAGQSGRPDSTPSPTGTPGPSETPVPSATPAPSATPIPEDTPEPSATPASPPGDQGGQGGGGAP